MKSIFFFDIDGTLTLSGTLPDYNKEMLLKLKSLNHLTFICSGRPFAYVDKIFHGLVDGYILSNGRYIYYHDQVIFDYPLTSQQIEKYSTICDQYQADYTFISDDKFYPNKPRITNDINDPYTKRSIYPWKKEDIKVYVMDIFYQNDAQFNQLVQAFKNDLILNNHFGHFSADTSTINHTKGDGIKKLYEYLNEPLTSYGFGDGHNDIGMFKEVDYKIAMGNAVQELKDMATYITTDCNQQGIIHALKHYRIF